MRYYGLDTKAPSTAAELAAACGVSTRPVRDSLARSLRSLLGHPTAQAPRAPAVNPKHRPPKTRGGRTWPSVTGGAAIASSTAPVKTCSGRPAVKEALSVLRYTGCSMRTIEKE